MSNDNFKFTMQDQIAWLAVAVRAQGSDKLELTSNEGK